MDKKVGLFPAYARGHAVDTVSAEILLMQMTPNIMMMDAARSPGTESMLSDMPLANEADGYLVDALQQMVRRARILLGWGTDYLATRSDVHEALFGTPEVLNERDKIMLERYEDEEHPAATITRMQKELHEKDKLLFVMWLATDMLGEQLGFRDARIRTEAARRAMGKAGSWIADGRLRVAALLGIGEPDGSADADIKRLVDVFYKPWTTEGGKDASAE